MLASAGRVLGLLIKPLILTFVPDCTEAIAFDGSELHLAFYGVLS